MPEWSLNDTGETGQASTQLEITTQLAGEISH